MADENCTLRQAIGSGKDPGAGDAWEEQRVLLRHYLERGLNKAEIARELGVSRRTVHNWIEGGQLDRDLDNAPLRCTPRPAVTCKTDAFRPIIDTRLAEFPKLTATRLFDEIRTAGYDGGYTQVKKYVRSSKWLNSYTAYGYPPRA